MDSGEKSWVRKVDCEEEAMLSSSYAPTIGLKNKLACNVVNNSKDNKDAAR